MMFLLLLVIFAATTAALWFQGLWSALVTLVNLILAMIIATSFYEPAATAIEGFGAGSWTYLLDFVVLWLLFFLAYSILRGVSDSLSKERVKFDLPIEMGGRSILAAICGWIMVCFVAFSLHLAPLNSPSPLGAWATPSSRSFGPVSPDRLWLGFMHSRSLGALAGNTFDPEGEFLLKYHDRRDKYAKEQAMRVGGQ
jgi:hypothetical protein